MGYKKKLLAVVCSVIALVSTVTFASTAQAATAILGNNVVGGQTDDNDSNHMNGSRFTTGAAGGTVTSMSVHVGAVGAAPNNQYQLAIYSDANNAPGTLINKSASATLTANSWNTVTMSATLTPNTSYWLMYNTNGANATSNNMHYNTGGQNAYSNSSVSFGTWPSNFGAATTGGANFSLYATYESDGEPTPPPPSPAPAPTDNGPGGPILVIADPANPYTRYYGEILKAEGINYYTIKNLSEVDSTVLAQYDVVLLGQMSLTDPQVTTLTDWVNGGGKLIAMRPDKKLTSLAGLTDQSATIADSYLKVSTASAPGAGITGDTMQYHSSADKYDLNGATNVAMLYSNATTATTNPAVTLRTVGSGQIAVWTFDLAKSIVQTRQGNVAWAGQQRDGIDGYEASEMFYGINGQPNWNDLSKAIIPIADEQQRLLANTITHMNKQTKPLPKFWYFPRELKAAVIMTGDDHGNGGTTGRFNNYISQSPAGCNVANWECIRSSSYMYTSTPVSDAQALSFHNQGFELGLHNSTNCAPWGGASLSALYGSQLASWKSKYASIPSPSSTRTHCVEWDDWATQAKAKQEHGIRLDTDYYYYPSSFTQNRPGYFNGTAQIMRFADVDGSIIDTYQATTQMTDESGQTYPYTIDTLLDAAFDGRGYYAALTANMHTDSAASSESDAVVAAAKARGVPVVSGRQMLAWLDARNSSAFSGMTWNGGQLDFAVTGGANGLRGMLPLNSTSGNLSNLTFNGNSIPFTTDTIKGITYAFFTANVGLYSATYTQDTVAPTVTTTVPTNNATNISRSAPVKVTFSEAMDPATLNGTNISMKDASNVTIPGSVSYDGATKTATLTPSATLAGNAVFTVTVQNVKDTAGNSLAAPYVFSFTTNSASQTLGYTSVGSSTDTSDSNHMTGSRFVTGAAPASVTSMTVHVGSVSAAPNNKYQLAIYNDNAGKPGTLVASSATGTLTANSWNTLQVSAALAANKAYWLMYNSNGTSSTSNNMHYTTGSSGQGAWVSRSFGTWPTTFGSSTLGNIKYSIYATY